MTTDVEVQRSSEAEVHLSTIERGRQLFENRNYKEALGIYLQLAETSYGSAIYLRLGWMYEFGMGADKDSQKAEYWYEKAAKAGISAGYYYLASMRLRAGKADEVKTLMEQAAARGYAPALFHLGQMYRFGKGVAVDVGRAYEFYEKAAELGHLFARRAIAQRMIRGDYGVWRIPMGFLIVAKIMWDSFWLYLKNPSDDRLRRPPPRLAGREDTEYGFTNLTP